MRYSFEGRVSELSRRAWGGTPRERIRSSHFSPAVRTFVRTAPFDVGELCCFLAWLGVAQFSQSLCSWGFDGMARRVGSQAYGEGFPVLVWTWVIWPADIEGRMAAELWAVGGSGLLGVAFLPCCLTLSTKGLAAQGDPQQPCDAGSGIFCARFSQKCSKAYFLCKADCKRRR